MTVSTDISRSGPYAGAGTTGPFTVNFRFLANSHLQVIRTASGVDTTLVLDTDYTVSGAGGSSGTVTLATALAVGQSLTIIRDVPFTQLADYVAGDSFPAQSHEDALDLLVMQTQQLKDGLDRSLTLAPTAVGASTELPAPQSLALIGWDTAGTALKNYDAGSLGVAIATASWRTEVFNGTGAQTAFILTQDAGVASNCDVSVSGVQQVADVNFSYNSTTKTVTFLTGAPASGTGNVAVRYGSALAAGTLASTSITDSTVTGRSVLTAASAAAARTAIGAGTVQAGDDSSITALLNASGVRVATRADVASAGTVVLTAAPDDIQITGTTSITGFTVPVGRVLRVRFAASLTLTNNANIVTQTGANIVTQAGDTCILRATAANVVEVLSYSRVAQATFATAVATTSGTAIDFTSIPAWINEIDVIQNAVSTSGASGNALLVQIGSGSVQTTGYLSYAGAFNNANVTATLNSTAGFLVTPPMGATSTHSGILSLKRISGNTWVASGAGGGLDGSSSNVARSSGGTVTLGGTLDRLRYTTTGTDTFDAGSVNLVFRG